MHVYTTPWSAFAKVYLTLFLDGFQFLCTEFVVPGHKIRIVDFSVKILHGQLSLFSKGINDRIFLLVHISIFGVHIRSIFSYHVTHFKLVNELVNLL